MKYVNKFIEVMGKTGKGEYKKCLINTDFILLIEPCTSGNGSILKLQTGIRSKLVVKDTLDELLLSLMYE